MKRVLLALLAIVAAFVAADCNNAKDIAFFKTNYNTFGAELNKVGKECYSFFRQSFDLPKAKSMLVAYGLSSGCAPCFAESIKCGTDNCKMKCMTNYQSSGCIGCIDQYCSPALKTCTKVDDLPPANPSGKDEL